MAIGIRGLQETSKHNRIVCDCPACPVPFWHTQLVHHDTVGKGVHVDPTRAIHQPSQHSTCKHVLMALRAGQSRAPPARRLVAVDMLCEGTSTNSQKRPLAVKGLERQHKLRWMQRQPAACKGCLGSFCQTATQDSGNAQRTQLLQDSSCGITIAKGPPWRDVPEEGQCLLKLCLSSCRVVGHLDESSLGRQMRHKAFADRLQTCQCRLSECAFGMEKCLGACK